MRQVCCQEGHPEFTHSRACVDRVGFLELSCTGPRVGLKIFVCHFQFLCVRIFCDSIIHVNAQAACSGLPTSGQHSLQHQDMGNATFHSRDTLAYAGTWTSNVTSLLQRLLYCKERCQLKLLRLLFFLTNSQYKVSTQPSFPVTLYLHLHIHLRRQAWAGRAELLIDSHKPHPKVKAQELLTSSGFTG